MLRMIVTEGPSGQKTDRWAAWLSQGTWCHHSHAEYTMTSQPHRACNDITVMQGICCSHAGYTMTSQPCRVYNDVTVMQGIWWHHSHSFTDLETQISWTQQSQMEMKVLTSYVGISLWNDGFWGGIEGVGLIHLRLDLNLQCSQRRPWISCLFSQVQEL